jgi:hypothetical protein
MATMKHIITLLVVTAFTVVVAQAGEECCKSKAACDSKAKAKAVKSDGTAKGAQQLVKK